jgi:hypothetical protein
MQNTIKAQDAKGIKALLVRAKTRDNTYYSYSRIFVGDNVDVSQAKIAVNMLATDITSVDAEEVTILPFDSVIHVDSYPYGSLRCDAYFSLEYSPKKGVRSVFQTINPKTGRINAPKKSTYSEFVFMYLDSKNHVQNYHIRIESSEINLYSNMFAEMYRANVIPDNVMEHLCLSVLMHTKVHAKVMCAYKGCKWEEIKPYFDAYVPALVDIIKRKQYVEISTIALDLEGINSKAPDNFQPFKASEPISIFDL